ncbi:Kinesin- motor protein, partial [Coemansia sp. RSA 2673]
MSKRTVGKQADNTQEKDTNIQVVVRCREAPTRNAKSNTSIVVAPEFGQDVKIDGPTSAQTYHYDGVFGPKATQEHIYERIVSPILDEVMQGYNCTIFAYGQTGTGKTYTMEGDLDASEVDHGLAVPALPSSNGNSSDLLCHSRLSTRAGVIPRTLHNLFYALDKQSAEYYVRVSYVELYNEELRDLLASNDVPGDAAGLKVFESGTDKGIIIQGLNEMAVTSARDAVAALQAGAQRRAVAATRCNEASSRSHAIFTITVFIRERAVTAEGEDIVKLGKLNLVDLAGSENIGRSGAQDMRAREAGNINKSLLVLGRVITALVEKNSYVPYRDSKLTYIIKDSLGGRTRTCMIATISTSAANIEETVKTLKRDLAAARDETGFYVARETYDALNADVAQARADSADWKQRVALWEAEAQRSATRIAELERAESEATARVNALDARNAQLT